VKLIIDGAEPWAGAARVIGTLPASCAVEEEADDDAPEIVEAWGPEVLVECDIPEEDPSVAGAGVVDGPESRPSVVGGGVGASP
jgi:hypothetical protein